jgi:hypothetical protein
MFRNLGGLVLVGLLAAAVWANDPWREKAYTDWTMDDIQKILSESPWVRTADVDAPWLPGAPHFLSVLPASCGGRPDLSKAMRVPPQAAMGPMTESVVGFQVTWFSAHTTRAAKLRLAVLCKQIDTDSDEADDVLSRPQQYYVISVTSPDMSPFDGMDETALGQNSYLLPKKTGKKVNPAKVLIGHGRDAQTVFNLTFEFPRNDSTGEPLITPTEKEVEFGVQAGKVTVKVKFQPPKMMDKNGLDL